MTRFCLLLALVGMISACSSTDQQVVGASPLTDDPAPVETNRDWRTADYTAGGVVIHGSEWEVEVENTNDFKVEIKETYQGSYYEWTVCLFRLEPGEKVLKLVDNIYTYYVMEVSSRNTIGLIQPSKEWAERQPKRLKPGN